MDLLFNLSQQLVLVKDLRGILDFDEVEKKMNGLVYKDNTENKISLEMHLLDDPVFADAKKTIVTECEQFLVHAVGLQGLFTKLMMTNSWANITEPHHSHHEHMHPFSVCSGTIFLDDNPSNMNLNIEAYLPQVPYFIPKNKSYASLHNLLIDQKLDLANIEHLKHHMVVFLSNFHHFVSKNENAPTRRSIAFNTFWDGMTGVAGENLGSHIF